MIDTFLQLLAPHPCISCGKIGAILCPNCKYNIVNDFSTFCIICGKESITGVCANHASPFESAWTVGIRKTVIQRLVGTYKFNGTRSAAVILADLLHHRIPPLSETTVITWVPTHPKRRRERGYDHMELLAKRFAKIRSLQAVPLLEKRTQYLQHKSNRRDRLTQVQGSFTSKGSARGMKVLLLDDIFTTGATINECAQTLHRAGVSAVQVAVIARQPLD